MEAFTVLLVISLILFDSCCLCYIKKNTLSALEKFVDKLIKEIED